jgi:hypothetical protein
VVEVVPDVPADAARDHPDRLAGVPLVGERPDQVEQLVEQADEGFHGRRLGAATARAIADVGVAGGLEHERVPGWVGGDLLVRCGARRRVTDAR